ncbi:hypothetical protein B0A49_04901 [Cryomyces minteri]|uniref:tRNA-splicing endonuclease subunit Sen2 n=1 Tax=Cryomyces minteri TaxID=331657 RepID=A0A4U0XCX6_9PEZI|nr:hypothetical protein B0A49_04901 [Cryomyces minteri]
MTDQSTADRESVPLLRDDPDQVPGEVPNANSLPARRAVDTKPQPRRPPKPNFNKIHAKKLPLNTFPLPTFVPQNPLTALHIAYILLKHYISPPSSHPAAPHIGYFSPETRSVHVTDPDSIRVLWEQGFFGKGSLSRSEPNWLAAERRRRGLLAGETAEEHTRKRRDERREFKMERARKEREAIEEQLRDEGKVGDVAPLDEVLIEGRSEQQDVLEKSRTSLEQGPIEAAEALSNGMAMHPAIEPTPPAFPVGETTASPANFQAATGRSHTPPLTDADVPIANEEHLQLNLAEAFFLTYGLGVLTVLSPSTNRPIPTSALLPLFRAHSSFPPSPPAALAPDDAFLLAYATYHHFRTLGWVVRPGVKFGVDWLLYNRGPVFAHAEFAVLVAPAYSHAAWAGTGRQRGQGQRDWWWLHCVNRVQSQVRKGLIVAFVEVPPPPPPPSVGQQAEREAEVGGEVDFGKLLRRYRVREFVIKRWLANRSRD